MLSKESKIRTLENFHALDYVFFGKPITEIKSCCPLVKEEYMSIKGALLSVHIEMLKLVEHTPEVIDEKVDSSELIKQAKVSARIARENSQAIVTTDKSRDYIKQTLKEMFKEDKEINLVEEMKNQIRQQAFSLAVDNLLIGRIIDESISFDNLNEWEGTIIEDSYKILRSNLVESAYEILEVKDELQEEERKKSLKETLKLAKEDGLLESILLIEKAGILSMQAANIYAEFACGLRGKDRLLKIQLGYRKCYWEKVLEYYKKRVGEYKNSAAVKCNKKTGDSKLKCVAKMNVKLAKTQKAIIGYQSKLNSVIERIKKKKGKTWKI